jgi:hypothetical protein
MRASDMSEMSKNNGSETGSEIGSDIANKDKKILLQIPIEYLDRFNRYKHEHHEAIRSKFYYSSQSDAFKYMLDKIYELDVQQDKKIEEDRGENIIKINPETKRLVEIFTTNFGIDEDSLFSQSLQYFYQYKIGMLIENKEFEE